MKEDTFSPSLDEKIAEQLYTPLLVTKSTPFEFRKQLRVRVKSRIACLIITLGYAAFTD